MKILSIILTSVVFFISLNSFSQNIVTPEGDTLVNISSEGLITDFDSGEPVGQIISNQVLDASGTLLGSINDEGNILDASGTLLYKVNNGERNDAIINNNEDETLSSIEGGSMFYVSGVFTLNASDSIDQKWLACYYYFFYN